MATDENVNNPHTPVPSKNLIVFLTRASVAVAHEFAYCTNGCTSRKGNEIAQPTNQENRKMKKNANTKSRRTNKNITARGTFSTLAK